MARSRFLGGLALAVVALAVGVGLAGAQSTASSETISLSVNVTVPGFDQSVLGVYTITTTVQADGSRAGKWDFQGTVSGQPSTASGLGYYTVESDGRLLLTLNTITTWDVPGVSRPQLPRRVTIQPAGKVINVAVPRSNGQTLTVPLAIDRALNVPVAGAYKITAVGSAQPRVTGLARTGNLGGGSLGLLGGLLTVGPAVALRARRRA